MRTKVLLLAGMLTAGTLASSHAGGAVGVRWGGGGGGAVGVRWGGGARWGGGGCYGGGYYGGGRYCGPGYYAPRAYYGGGWGWRRSVVVVAPAPVYTTAYVAAAPAPVVAYSGSVVVVSQQRLARMGYYNGPIDGEFGPMTSSAVTRYQQDYGLSVTGRLDRNTRASLGL